MTLGFGLLLALCFFALGAIAASFIGVLVARLNTGQDIIFGRSHCDACGRTLDPLSLVPILSYIALTGRAHCCGARIPWTAPATESLLGALFALAYLTLGLESALAPALVALALLLALVLYDQAHQILPPSLLFAFVPVAALTGYLSAPSIAAFGVSLMYAGAFAFVLALINFASKGRAMGLSDSPLVFGLSLMVGGNAFAGFLYSFWIGAFVGIVILLRLPKDARRGVEVPFAPFLAAGYLLAFFLPWNPFIFAASAFISG